MIKKLHVRSRYDIFDLTSRNEDPIHDVQLVRATKVLGIFPPERQMKQPRKSESPGQRRQIDVG